MTPLQQWVNMWNMSNVSFATELKGKYEGDNVLASYFAGERLRLYVLQVVPSSHETLSLQEQLMIATEQAVTLGNVYLSACGYDVKLKLG